MSIQGDCRTQILVVDDDVLHLEALADLLEMEGLRTLRATHPAAALELFAIHRDSIGLALLDLEMPGIGGAGLALELSRAARPPEILILTGSGDFTRRTRELLTSVREVFRKPCDWERLLAHATDATKRWQLATEGAR